MGDVEDLTRSDSESPEPLTRREILGPAIQSVIAALGGFEDDRYVLGDEAYGCLKDLKKFWRKDDSDDDRTVARIFWEARVLHNDLIPILLETAGKGLVEHRCAVACLDLITAMTWPIDMAVELMELDEAEDDDKKADYTTLLFSHLHYKAAILSPGVLEAVIGILLPCLTKEKKERQPRDGQVINVALYLFRNLAFIKDPPKRTETSADSDELSQLQSKLVLQFQECNIFQLLLTLASNSADDPLFNTWNTLLLETFYLCFRSVKPSALIVDQAKSTSNELASLLEIEERHRAILKRNAPTRHGRFGTTVAAHLGSGNSLVLSRQAAVAGDVGSLLDLTKKKQTKKTKIVDDLGTFDTLSYEARTALQTVGKTFVESCFNTFLTGLLKDIRAERAKVMEKDNLRLLFVAKWFMEYFLALNAKEKAALPKGKHAERWTFDLVADIVERPWIAWMLKRMRGALEEKPKQWTELQAGLECVTQLLLLVQAMSGSGDEELVEAAEALQHQLYYNGEIMDLAFDSLKSYKEQSLAYLHATVHLAYTLLRMLEDWGKTKGEMYVQKKKKKKTKSKGRGNANEEMGVVDAVEEVEIFQSVDMVNESLITFEKYQAKFADEDINHTLLTYLAQYKSFDSPKSMNRVVKLLYRQAVSLKAEGLFFKVSTLSLFKGILKEHEQKMLPTDQPHVELLNLIKYVLRQFFKAVEKDPFLVVEAFFPKNRGTWKQFSSWEPEVKEKKKRGAKGDDETGEELVISKRFTWSQQVGIAVGCLVDAGKGELVDWTKEILTVVISQRQRDVEETDIVDDSQEADAASDDGDMSLLERRTKDLRKKDPSAAAVAKFKDYVIPYASNEKAHAATKNSYLKLLWKLINFDTREQTGDELEWYVPRELFPDALNQSLKTIDMFLEDPIDIDGKRPKQLTSKKRKRRARAASDSESDPDATEERSKRRAKKKKEEQVYKSAALIEDSDAEIGDDDAFFERERALREKNLLKANSAAADTAAAPGPRGGTKKKKKRASETESGGAKKRRKTSAATIEKAATSDVDNTSDKPAVTKSQPVSSPSSSSPPTPEVVERIPLSRRPKPGYLEVDDDDEVSAAPPPEKNKPLFHPDSDDDDEPFTQPQPRRAKRMVIDDEDDE
ncbi:timeless-domain-containing protein [Exidia glandulosa HHB12029]|uniref:Timeless-domain-containing protein n=1 Tax=Exidia glandulosa HHB12029 TaxID=1314781 RepID=A0A165QLH8_EXIGL|nr:timeless-domain-containing protein [Exidia glandulosa HHB12029]